MSDFHHVVSLVDEHVVIDLPGAWLDAPERSSIVWWLEDVATITPNGDITRIALSRDLWSVWSALPSAGSDDEEIDIWRRRHEVLAVLGRRAHQRLDIAAVGYVQGRDLSLSLNLDGEVRLDSTPEPIAKTHSGTKLLLPIVYEAWRLASQVKPKMGIPAQLAAVGALKNYVSRARTFLADSSASVEILFDAHLDAIKFTHVDRAALSWSTTGRTNDIFELNLEVREPAVHESEAYQRLDIGKLDPAAPIISVSGKEHVLLTDEIATVARIAKKNRNKLRKHVAEALVDPKKVLPEGTGFTFDGIDLSRYSPRVSGFEPIVRADRPVDIRSSGTVWYDSGHDAPFLRLEIAQSDGSQATLEFQAPSDARVFVEKAVAAKDATIRHEDQEVAPTPALVERVREHLMLHEQREAAMNASETSEAPSPGEEDEAPKKTGGLVAIIKEVDQVSPLANCADVDEGAVPWETVESLLLPGVELKPHQRQGIAWLWHHRQRDVGGVLLADDMGLGKTLQVATFLALVKATAKEGEARLPSLIIAPIILLDNWKRELEKFFRPEAFESLVVLRDAALRRHVEHGVLKTAGLQQLDWILTNYESLARFQQQLLAMDFDTVVLDEAQAIKNPDAIRTRAARGLKRRFAICSTGTPVENRLLDLWALYDFLSPGHPFASRSDFEKRYEADIPSGISGIRDALRLPAPSSTLLRRTKKEALSSLPPKEERLVLIPMTEEQVSLERLVTRNQGRVLETLHSLQKIYQHPRLLKKAEGVENRHFSADEIIAESPKLAKVIEILEEVRAKREKAIVFTVWTAMQDLLAQVLKSRMKLRDVPIINGDTNQRGGAQKHLDEFEKLDGFGVLILSPLAAGTGLTITAANHVIHYGRWWNPAKEDQATDRAYRIGQTRPVYVHYPVLHHPHDPTVGFDVKLHALVSKKRAMARDFLDPANIAEISKDELDAIAEEP